MNKFEQYNSSQIVPQRTLLEKFNKLIGYLVQNPTINIFRCTVDYVETTTAYDIEYFEKYGKVIQKGDAILFNNAFVGFVESIGEDYITILSAVNIGNGGGGETHTFSVKGWYFKTIDFVSKKIYLSAEQVTPTEDTGTVEPFNSGFAVGDTLHIINKRAYDITITNINQNCITVEELPFDFIETIIETDITDFSVYSEDKPQAGGVELAEYSFVVGNGTFGIWASSVTGNGAKALASISHAEGWRTEARGCASHAEGYETQALYANTHAEGSGTKAVGTAGHAEGFKTEALGNSSHAENNITKAGGVASHAEGYNSETGGEYEENTKTSGTNTGAGAYSHAEGNATIAQGISSHSEGRKTFAKGRSSHAEGENTTASGSYSHAEGYGTVASNPESHAEGFQTKATGTYAHAENNSTEANGKASHAEGFYTIANGKSQHVFGEYNLASDVEPDEKSVYVEIVGNGTGNTRRSNARTLDWEGNEILAGKLTVGREPSSNRDVATKGYVDGRILIVQSSSYITLQDSSSSSVPALTYTQVNTIYSNLRNYNRVVYIRDNINNMDMIVTSRALVNGKETIYCTFMNRLILSYSSDGSSVTINYTDLLA